MCVYMFMYNYVCFCVLCMFMCVHVRAYELVCLSISVHLSVVCMSTCVHACV